MSEITLTTQDLIGMEYWTMARSEIVRLFGKVASDQVYGLINKFNVNKLRMYKFIYEYLGIMYEERAMDLAREGTDLGDDYYKELYCIKSIKKALVCKGINPSLIDFYFSSTNVYDIATTVVLAATSGYIIKTGSKYLPAESEVRVYYTGNPFPNTDYTLSVWSYDGSGNRVELQPIAQAKNYFVVKPLEGLTIRYSAVKQ